MQRPELVERRDDAMPQRDVGLQQAADERLLGLGRPDAHQYGRQLAPDVLRRLDVAQYPFDLRDDVVAVAGERAGGFVDEL